MWVVVIGMVVFVVGFATIVLPLMLTGSFEKAEVTGVVDANGGARVGQEYEIDVGFDNTGGPIIRNLCILMRFDPPVDVRRVTFVGFPAQITPGRACGGELAGQETISARIVLVPRGPGDLHVSLSPGDGTRSLGKALTGTVHVDR